MKRFVARYFLFLALMFVLFYAPTSAISTLLNDGQTNLTLYFLNQFLEPGQLQGNDIWVHSNYKIIINKACNGMIPILFLFASILAYLSTWLQKVLWMSVGYVLFSVVNVARILMVVHYTQTGAGHEDFFWSHDLVGNVLLMLTGLGLFIAFIKTSSCTVKDY